MMKLVPSLDADKEVSCSLDGPRLMLRGCATSGLCGQIHRAIIFGIRPTAPMDGNVGGLLQSAVTEGLP